MKYFTAPALFALILLSQCTTVNRFLMDSRTPGIDLLKFEPGDLDARRTSVYKLSNTTVTIDARWQDAESAVLMVRDSADDREITFNGDRVKKNALSYEYHFDANGAVSEVYLTDGKNTREMLDRSAVPVHDAKPVAEKKGYTIMTHAGEFDCTMRIEKEADSYYVFFLNASILGRVARCHILDESDYKAFTALDKKRQESFLSKEMIEIYSAK